MSENKAWDPNNDLLLKIINLLEGLTIPKQDVQKQIYSVF